MPFRAEFELKAKDSRALWTKAINAYHTISDSFKIVIFQGTDSGVDELGRKCFSEVEFITMNKTKTTVLNISFKECFFKRFSIDGEIATDESERYRVKGNQFTHNYAKSYTLIVNSQDMNILFKDCGVDAVSWKIFMLAGNEISHMVYSHKLFVEFDTRSGMKKKYSIAFRPGINMPDDRIHCIYLKTLENQKRRDEILEGAANGDGELDDANMFDDDEDERIHRVALNTLILRRFIQSFPPTLEDFQIGVAPIEGTLFFKGFNRQQVTSKVESMSNRPMTLSIRMRLDQIVYNNIRDLGPEGNDENKEKSEEEHHISFRLKNFKTFIQIISGNLTMFNDDDTFGKSRAKAVESFEEGFTLGDDDNICDIMFSKPGYPIIFEKRYFMNGVSEMQECSSVTLTEVTDGESRKLVLDAGNMNVNDKLANLTLPAANNGLVGDRLRTVAATTAKREDDVQIMDVGEPLFVAEEGDNMGESNTSLVSTNVGDGERRSAGGHSEDFEKLFWDNSKFHQSRVVEKALGAEQELEREPDEEEEEDEKEVGEEYLGPTQDLQVKGIFD
ncbi:hypothetical protein PMKS-000735 [Pichia membranifaciens]|uniref:Uncharacterized protein n=1 Tax=Pichia membranifaciens TaxID=4926 RepID=A0A1Q2YCP0_9ASCO|nr:hypothetical protein PMKS-000735 [Pichia membranifaciens]